MRTSLRKQLESSRANATNYFERLGTVERGLRSILHNRRFNRGQRKALESLLPILHIPSTIERMNVLVRDVYRSAIEQNMMRPSSLLKVFNIRVPGKWRVPIRKKRRK